MMEVSVVSAFRRIRSRPYVASAFRRIGFRPCYPAEAGRHVRMTGPAQAGHYRRILALLLLCVAGCNRAADTGKLTIAVIPKGTSHVFWQSIHAGAEKAAQELGVGIVWRGPLREDDRDSQVSEVEGFITRGISGIVLAPLDESALVGPVADAKRSNIPVVVIDSGLKGSDYVSFVATDNRKGGRMAGDHLASLLHGTGSVVMLRYAEGSESTVQREEGFLEAIAAHPGITVVSANQYGGADVEGAYKKSESLLSRYKQGDGTFSVNGIFCPNESTTLAMMRVLDDNGLAGKVRFVGFDASDTLVKGLADGHIDGLVLQDPVNMGYLGVKSIVTHIRGGAVERRIDTGVRLVTRDRMNDPDMKELLHPDLARWLKR
jgi:ribose transport system substrate-binding protein